MEIKNYELLILIGISFVLSSLQINLFFNLMAMYIVCFVISYRCYKDVKQSLKYSIFLTIVFYILKIVLSFNNKIYIENTNQQKKMIQEHFNENNEENKNNEENETNKDNEENEYNEDNEETEKNKYYSRSLKQNSEDVITSDKHIKEQFNTDDSIQNNLNNLKKELINYKDSNKNTKQSKSHNEEIIPNNTLNQLQLSNDKSTLDSKEKESLNKYLSKLNNKDEEYNKNTDVKDMSPAHAQRELFRLIDTTSLLKKTMTEMTPVLNEGKKIMKSIEALNLIN